MLVIAPEFRNHPKLLSVILKTLFSLLARKQINHCFFSIADFQLSYISDIPMIHLNQPIPSDIYGFPIIPSILKIKEFEKKENASIQDKEILRFQQAFYRIILEPGDFLAVEGEKGTTAYIILSGDVEVLKKVEDKIIHIKTLSAGNIIGEIGLVTGEPRTASVMAKNSVICIGFDRERFLEVMIEHPNRMFDMFQIFSNRISQINHDFTVKAK